MEWNPAREQVIFEGLSGACNSIGLPQYDLRGIISTMHNAQRLTTRPINSCPNSSPKPTVKRSDFPGYLLIDSHIPRIPYGHKSFLRIRVPSTCTYLYTASVYARTRRVQAILAALVCLEDSTVKPWMNVPAMQYILLSRRLG